MDSSTSELSDDSYVDVAEPIKGATPPTSFAGGAAATPTFPLEQQERTSRGKEAGKSQPPAGLKSPSQMRYLTRVTDVIYGEVSNRTQGRLVALPKSSTELELQPDDPPPLYPRTVSMVGSQHHNVMGKAWSSSMGKKFHSSMPRSRSRELHDFVKACSLQHNKRGTEPIASTNAPCDIRVVGKGSCNQKTTLTTATGLQLSALNEDVLPSTIFDQSQRYVAAESISSQSSEENGSDLPYTPTTTSTCFGEPTDHERKGCEASANTKGELGNSGCLSPTLHSDPVVGGVTGPSTYVHYTQKLAENSSSVEPSANDSDSSTDYEELVIYEELADNKDSGYEDINQARIEALGLPKTIRHRAGRIVKGPEGTPRSVTVGSKMDEPSGTLQAGTLQAGTLKADLPTEPKTATRPQNRMYQMHDKYMSHDEARQVLDMLLEADNVQRLPDRDKPELAKATAGKATVAAETSTPDAVALSPEVAEYQKLRLLLSKSPSEVAEEIRFLTDSAPKETPQLPGIQRSRAKVVAQSDDVVRKRKMLQKTKTFPAYEQTAMHNNIL